MLIEEDCTLLLERALLHKTLCAFGEDGFGQYGRSETPHYFQVRDLFITIEADDDDSPTTVWGQVMIKLDGYDADITGHIKTDKNFDISLNAALTAAGLSTKSLIWAAYSEQPKDGVTFHINVGELLDW